MARYAVLAAIVYIGLSGCDDAPTRNEDQGILSTAIKLNQVGNSTDLWLEKSSSFGGWDRVALVFGYWDDYEGCTEIVEELTRRNPLARYRCTPAN